MAIIKEQIGDIFTAPPHSILIHACNARGSWGAGVALAFKKKYLAAFKTYNSHCLTPPDKTPLSKHQHSLVGTTLLIPPGPKTPQQHWIACLFTSQAYGRSVSPPNVILESTKKALEDLARQVEDLKKQNASGQQAAKGDDVPTEEKQLSDGEGKSEAKQDTPGECWAVRINSGMFGVPWQDTKAVLEAGKLDMVIVRPAGEDDNSSGGEGKGPGQEVNGKAAAARKTRDPNESGGKDEAGGDQRANKRAKTSHDKSSKKPQKNGLDGWLKG